MPTAILDRTRRHSTFRGTTSDISARIAWSASKAPKYHFWSWFSNQHSDFIDPFAFTDLLRNARTANLRAFDIMLEAKAKDLALLRLREQVARFAPDLAAYIG